MEPKSIMGQPAGAAARPATASASTALSLRVSKVLATNFEDPTTRTALKILNSFGTQDEATSDASVLPADLHSLKKGGLRRVVEGRIRLRSREFLEIFTGMNNVSIGDSASAS